MALDAEIKRLYAVAASPELYQMLVELGTVRPRSPCARTHVRYESVIRTEPVAFYLLAARLFLSSSPPWLLILFKTITTCGGW